MSILQSGITAHVAIAKRKKGTGHRIRVTIVAMLAFLTVASIATFGANYYLLPLSERPYSDKYELLKPGGTIGLKLGILGTFLFFIIFLYALRKLIPWLNRLGTARQWMDFHVIAGVTAPIIIAFHASFKFQGIAGVAFWIMLAVALSGVIGRYLYAQIPRSLSAAELSLSDLHAGEKALSDALLSQSIYSAERVNRTVRRTHPAHQSDTCDRRNDFPRSRAAVPPRSVASRIVQLWCENTLNRRIAFKR
jgi:cation transport ATPase